MARPHVSPDPAWSSYVQQFHAERPGITERILTRCHADGLDPYQWCAQALDGRTGPVLDLACGSGPMADRLGDWVGADTSEAELRAAKAHDRSSVMRASATRLPVRTDALDAAACSMGMQIIDPVTSALLELGRVLRPGGRATLLVPANRPLPWRHALTYWRLQAALRARLQYPNERALRSAPLHQLASAAGLKVTFDERVAFTLPLPTGIDADELLASLYLPDVDPTRLAAGRRVLAGCIGGALTVPLRRIVLDRAGVAA